jgi:hypothetical protein
MRALAGQRSFLRGRGKVRNPPFGDVARLPNGRFTILPLVGIPE